MTATTPLREMLEPLLADPGRAAVLLDIDGTLAPIVRHADDAHVPDSTRRPLIRIAKRYGLVACVSGRRAAVARRIVALGSITYLGNHGSEVLRGGETSSHVAPEAAGQRSRVRAFAERAIHDDALVAARVRPEDKDAIYAFHWRGAPDEAAAVELLQELARRAEAEGLGIHWGRKVLEIRPAIELDKGTGVDAILAEHGQVRSALYIGDDMTDLDAFRALRTRAAAGLLDRAICIGVRSDETPSDVVESADMLVDGPAGVRNVLELLADGN